MFRPPWQVYSICFCHIESRNNVSERQTYPRVLRTIVWPESIYLEMSWIQNAQSISGETRRKQCCWCTQKKYKSQHYQIIRFLLSLFYSTFFSPLALSPQRMMECHAYFIFLLFTVCKLAIFSCPSTLTLDDRYEQQKPLREVERGHIWSVKRFRACFRLIQ